MPGSPPHARGRPFLDDELVENDRITPACAGKTTASPCTECRRADHPRMRGEDALHYYPVVEHIGSPPHARGRLIMTALLTLTRRITPACAGKTSYRIRERTTQGDHPRMRGEDTARIPANTPATGSPPHARGRRDGGNISSHRQRITPACAGKTSLTFSAFAFQ